MSNWDQRQLCPDGACVGVIGPEGTCKVCGRVAPNWGDERKRGLLEPDEVENRELPQPAGTAKTQKAATAGALYFDIDPDDQVAPDRGPTVPSDRDWDQRTLCADDACIGVIGRNGKCKVCGKPAPGSASAPGSANAPSDVDDDEYDGDEYDDDEYDDDEDGEYEDEDEEEEEEEDEGEDNAGAAASASPEWDERKLCPDDGCIGVIGPNGTCKVCGRRAA